MLLSYCVYQKVFSAAVSKNKKVHFSCGQMLKADKYSLIHPLNYGK